MKKIHYAWVVCGCGLLAMLCNLGLSSNILAVYLPFIEKAGLTDAQGSMMVSIRCLSSFACTFFVSVWYRKFPLRLGLTLATLIGAVGTVVLSIGGSTAVYWIGAAVLGIGYGFGTMIPISLLMTRWFDRRRATAISVCSAGTGLASIIFAPLITANTLARGLRSTFLMQAAFMALCAGIIFFLVRTDPADKGLAPFGEGTQEEGKPKRTASAADFDLPQGIHVLMLLMLGLMGGCGVAASGHVSVAATSAGYTAASAGLCATLYGFALLGGKLLFGHTADKIGSKRASILFMLIFCVAGVTSVFLNGSSTIALCVFPLLLGVGCAFYTIGMPLWAADLAAPKDFERLLKHYQLMYAAGGIVLASIPGRIADATHEYRTSYLLMAAGVLAGILMLLYFYKRRKKEYR